MRKIFIYLLIAVIIVVAGLFLFNAYLIGEGGEGGVGTDDVHADLDSPFFFLFDRCQFGLKAIGATWPDDGGGCMTVNCPCFVCAKCGNGVCGPGENKCNCSEDCK